MQRHAARVLSLGVALAAGCAAPGDDVSTDVNELGAAGSARAALVDGALTVTMPGAASCASCTDADGDGLADSWESMLLERVRPRIVFHPDDPMVNDPAGNVGLVARVFPVSPTVVRVIFVVAFAFDDGVQVLGFSVTGHDGDGERVALELGLEDGGRRATLRRAYFSAHEGMPNEQSRTVSEGEVRSMLRYGRDGDGQPRWLVFPSEGKHAEFPSYAVCSDTSLWGTGWFSEKCGEDEERGRAIDPRFVNAGEKDGQLVDDLSAVGYPREHAWDGSRFCGGLRDAPRHGVCGRPMDAKLLTDPFER